MDILAFVVIDVDVDVGVDTVDAVVNIVPTNAGGEVSLVFALPSTCPTRARGVDSSYHVQTSVRVKRCII